VKFSHCESYIGSNIVLYRVVAAAMEEVETCMRCGKTFSEGRGMGNHLVVSPSCSVVYKNPPSSFTEHSSALRAHNRSSWNGEQQSSTHDRERLETGNVLEADHQHSGVSDNEGERGPARASGSMEGIPNLAGDDDDVPYFEEEDPSLSSAAGEVDDHPTFSGDEEYAIMHDDAIEDDTFADGSDDGEYADCQTFFETPAHTNDDFIEAILLSLCEKISAPLYAFDLILEWAA
jgi:hypothetical protein